MTSKACAPKVLCGISRDFSRLSPCKGQVAYVLLTRAPVAGRREQALASAAPRLACVKPVASVHPEPGSNSSLLLILFFFFSNSKQTSIFKYLPVTRHLNTRSAMIPDRWILARMEFDRVELVSFLRPVTLLYYFSSVVKLSMFSCLPGQGVRGVQLGKITASF